MTDEITKLDKNKQSHSRRTHVYTYAHTQTRARIHAHAHNSDKVTYLCQRRILVNMDLGDPSCSGIHVLLDNMYMHARTYKCTHTTAYYTFVSVISW